MDYRPDVDGLRAIAVLPVLFFHAGFDLFGGGYIGVDVFFVISGYLITCIILREIELGRFSIWGFYNRRIRRITPAALFVCAVTVPFAWLLMLPQEFEDYSKSLYATMIAGANFHFWYRTEYFSGSADFQPLLHMWSLAVEEQFYFIFPFLLLFFRRNLIAIIGAIAAVSFVASLYIGRIDPEANFYLLPSRFWQLASGALVAIAAVRIRSRAVGEVMAATGLMLVLFSVVLMDGGIPYPGWYALAPVAGTVLLLCTDGKTLTGRILAWRPLVGVGLISYGLYLWHQPVFAFARMGLFGELSKGIYVALICATFLLSYATWRLIEQPFRNRALIGDRKVFVSAVAGGTAIFAVGLVGDLGDGLAGWRAPNAQVALIKERMRPNTGLSGRCDGEIPLPEVCRTSETPEILVWGDSFAMHLVPGIVASNPSVQLVQFTKSACGPVLGIAPATIQGNVRWAEECLKFMDAMKAYVEQTDSLRIAVLGSPFDQYLDEAGAVLVEGDIVLNTVSPFAGYFSQTLLWLRQNGIEPVVFLPPPTDGSEIGACLARSVWLGVSTAYCDYPAEESARRSRTVALLNDLDVRTIDVAEAFCDTETCFPAQGGALIFRDADHLSYEGAEYIGRKMSLYGRLTAGQVRDIKN